MPQPVAPDDRLKRILERDWHADVVEFLRTDVPRLLAVFLLAFVLQRLVTFFVGRMLRLADRQIGNAQRASQLRTMAGIIRATSYGILGFIVLLHVLSIFNINLTPLLASAGVVGVGIGLGAQSIFKDMLNGIFILVEDQYNIGDIVKIAGLQGTVEDLSLRLTRLRDGDGTLHMIPNSQVSTVSNLSRDYAIAMLSVSVDASANPDQVMEVLREVAGAVRNDPAFAEIILSDPTVLGVDKISGREILYPINFRVRPNQRDVVLRELRRRIVLTFEQHGVPLGSDSSLLIMARDVPGHPGLPAPPRPGSAEAEQPA